MKVGKKKKNNVVFWHIQIVDRENKIIVRLNSSVSEESNSGLMFSVRSEDLTEMQLSCFGGRL